MIARWATAGALLMPATGALGQGVALFGDARLGLGYNINNDGSVSGEQEARAVSRVRFGVNMSGETGDGLTFGATIRADNAVAGEGAAAGQIAGSVFVSGAWGTLTYGDADGADENWVGDVPGNLSLTGLGDLHETPFVSNGGSFGDDVANDLLANPVARPTLRYDFDVAGFGASVSSNRDLTDIQVGAGYAGEIGGGTWSIGVGYDDFAAFTTVGDPEAVLIEDFPIGDDNIDLLLASAPVEVRVPAGRQWSAGLSGDYGGLTVGATYTNTDSDGSAAFETLSVGGAFTIGQTTIGAYWQGILSAEGNLAPFYGRSAYGLTGSHDLGGGAAVAGGIVRTFGRDGFEADAITQPALDAEIVADFGVRFSF